MQYRITSETHLTPNGVLGVWLFIGGPLLTGAGWYWMDWLLFAARPAFLPMPSMFFPLVVIAAGGMASVVGFVLLLVGRHHTYTAFPFDQAIARPEESWRRR